MENYKTARSGKPSRIRTSLLIALIVLAAQPSFAQKGYPMPENGVVTYALDAEGKVTTAPANFVLKHGREYDFKVAVANAESQQKAFFSDLSKSLKAAVKNLDDPDMHLKELYGLLLNDIRGTKVHKMRSQWENLSEILADANPKAKFDASPDSFEYLLGRSFLAENLFGNIFTLSHNMGANSSLSTAVSKPDAIEFKKTVKFPETKVEIRMTDLRKQFLVAYFNESKKWRADIIDTLRPAYFYGKADSQMVALNGEIASFITRIDSETGTTICDPAFQTVYRGLLDKFSDSPIITLLTSGWMERWGWYNEGVPILNPFQFTDEANLRLQAGYDSVQAKRYDAFIESTLDWMVKSPELNNVRTSISLFDTLNTSKKGEEIYSHKRKHGEIKAANKAAMNSFQAANTLISELRFRTVNGDSPGNYLVKSYDASENLLSAEAKISSLPNNYKLDLLVYNLKAGDTVTLKSSGVAIADESEMTSEIKEAGGLIAALSGPSAQLEMLGKSFFQSSLSSIPQFNLTGVDQKALLGDFAAAGGSTKSVPVTSDSSASALDLDARIDRYLAANNLTGCPGTRDAILQDVNMLLKVPVRFDSQGNVIGILTVENLEQLIDSIIYEHFATILTSSIKSGLRQMRSLIRYAVLMSKENKLQLPPTTIKLTDKPGQANYGSVFLKSPVDNSSIKKSIDLVMYQKPVPGKTVSRDSVFISETYKTGPLHRFSSSMGVSRVFNEFSRTEISVTDNELKNTIDKQQTRVIAGFSYHLFRHVKTDDRFFLNMRNWRESLSRIALYGGLSFPKPLYNLHAGISVDVIPGLKLIGGMHLYRETTYDIVNNQIANQRSRYVGNGAFVSLSLEPVSLINLLGIVKL